MARERTFSIVKPDAVRANHIGGILAKLDDGDVLVTLTMYADEADLAAFVPSS